LKSIATPSLERIRWTVGVTVAALAATLAVAPPAAAHDAPSLEAIAASQPSKTVTVIVQLEDGVDPDRVASLAEHLDGRVNGGLPIIDGLAVKMDAEDALALKDSPLVREATVNARMRPQAVGSTGDLVTSFPLVTRAKEAWTRAEARVTGDGVGVAVIDTGIAGDLPDFRISDSNRSSRVIASVVTNPGASSAADTVGHGTHVAGIIAGNSNHRASVDPYRGRYIGVAPDADLISVNVADAQGDATVLDVIRGLDFVIQHHAALNIRVVNLSLASAAQGSYLTDPLNAAVESAWKQGIVVVAAAGNRGTEAGAVSYAPANDPFVITVGGTDDRGSRKLGDDLVADWSSRGTTADGVDKPEIYAPGARLVAPLAPNSLFTQLCPACVLGGSYIRASGTSMSAPVVAGAAALLLQKYPGLTPDQVKGSLLRHPRYAPNGVKVVSPYAAIRGVREDGPVTANQGLVPNEAVDPATGEVDETRSRWSRSRWSTADGDLAAGYARSSWSCADCDDTSGSSAEETRSSWSGSSWSMVPE
jgi:serine protease AprX